MAAAESKDAAIPCLEAPPPAEAGRAGGVRRGFAHLRWTGIVSIEDKSYIGWIRRSGKGCEIRTVQELLGHRSVKTTMIYTHVLNRGGRGVQSPLDLL
jgi:integrase